VADGAAKESSEPSGTAAAAATVPFSLRELVLYFLRLGTFGFGGPIALAGYMQRDLVERRRWFSHEDYVEGLALAQLAPGPLAAQLAMYLGWVRAKAWGATLVAVAFVLPSFLMVVALSILYLAYGGLPWMQGIFYGVGAAVIAIILRSAWKLVKLTLKKDALLWTIFVALAVVTAWTEREIAWVFVLAGVVALFVRAPPKLGRGRTALGVSPWAWTLTGIHGLAAATTLGQIALYFTEAGAFVFGSGLAIVPFLYGGVVQKYHWLDERQFLDAVAVAMITPGPVVITVGFIGYLVAGPLGAVVAAAATFLPCYLCVVIAAPHYRRWSGNLQVKAFVAGVTAAATGAIAGSAFILGRRAVVDVPTALVCAVTLLVILTAKKVPEPLVIVAAGLVGWAVKAWSGS
jgi:chromate transporter